MERLTDRTILADKVYDTDAFRALLEESLTWGLAYPQKRTGRTRQNTTRDIIKNATTSRTSFKNKEFRAVAARYEKLDSRFRSFCVRHNYSMDMVPRGTHLAQELYRKPFRVKMSGGIDYWKKGREPVPPPPCTKRRKRGRQLSPRSRTDKDSPKYEAEFLRLMREEFEGQPALGMVPKSRIRGHHAQGWGSVPIDHLASELPEGSVEMETDAYEGSNRILPPKSEGGDGSSAPFHRAGLPPLLPIRRLMRFRRHQGY
ncbi:MAG: hypothetical protein R3F11_00330 [Verrucomicrobiales bacterium]